MKYTAWLIIPILFGLSLNTAIAQQPCPTQDKDAQAPLDPNEKCKPQLGKTAPVLFQFPDDPKPEGTAKPAEQSDIKPEAKPQAQRPVPQTCTYDAYAWDTRKKSSTGHFKVSKPYAEVTDEERDPNAPDCTICVEDQVSVNPRDFGVDHGPIKICHAYADQVRQALAQIAQSKSFDIQKLEGYRPGKTRGKVDKDGLRTQWSQHSFGTAIDINANHNAIYSSCPEKLTNQSAQVKSCKRGIGGAWQPEKQPRVSIVKDGIVYQQMTQFWKWGGEIDGPTKDIMHFSITGY